jgi:hypothetical protein
VTGNGVLLFFSFVSFIETHSGLQATVDENVIDTGLRQKTVLGRQSKAFAAARQRAGVKG